MRTPACILVAVMILFENVCQSEETTEIEQIKENLKKYVNIRGQVMRPRIIPYRDTTIYAAILAAGGPTKFGTLKRVKVMREGKAILFDLTNEKTRNEELVRPGDSIEVPQASPPERDITLIVLQKISAYEFNN